MSFRTLQLLTYKTVLLVLLLAAALPLYPSFANHYPKLI